MKRSYSAPDWWTISSDAEAERAGGGLDYLLYEPSVISEIRAPRTPIGGNHTGNGDAWWIVLFGGSTRIPHVVRLVSTFFDGMRSQSTAPIPMRPLLKMLPSKPPFSSVTRLRRHRIWSCSKLFLTPSASRPLVVS